MESSGLYRTPASGPAEPLLRPELSYGTAIENNGNVRGVTVKAGATFTAAQTYQYDAVNRLQEAAEGTAWKQTFGHDRHGNRWIEGGALSFGIDSKGAPSGAAAYNASNNRLGSNYDAAGNMWAHGQRMIYDVENRLVRIENPANNAVFGSYEYDGEGRRVKKTAGADTTIYVYDAQGQLAAEYQTAAIATSEADRRYLFADHLGNTRLRTNGAGTAVDWWDYAPFGEEIPGSASGRSGVAGVSYGTLFPKARFGGKERDVEGATSASLGLDYLGARYMSAAQGRFTSPDAPFADQDEAAPQSWNLYSYARNNPLRYVDPDGQRVQICIIGEQCFEVDDADYPGLQPGNAGVVLPTFNFGRDSFSVQGITCGGQNCGTATYINEDQGAPAVYFPLREIAEASGLPLPNPKSLGQGLAAAARSFVLKLLTNRRTSLLQTAKNPKLKRSIERLYRENAVVGTGSTADAIRHELATGQLLSPKGPVQKGVEMRDALQKMYRNPNLSSDDKQIVRELLTDLQNALSGR